MVRTGSYDDGPEDSGGDRPYETDPGDREQDPVSSLNDTDDETGDEIGLIDSFTVDSLEAEKLGVALDRVSDQEPELN